MYFNDPFKLPPVGCNFIIKVGDAEIKVFRTSHISNKYGDMLEYQTCDTGETIIGRYFFGGMCDGLSRLLRPI